MRHGMIILAVFGLLVGPTLSADEDPFDFSQPLGRKSPRAAQYFSRTGAEEKPTASVRFADAEAPAAYRRAVRPSTAELLGDVARERQQNESAGERAENAAEAGRRNPQETLQRFDEFLQSRDVVPAGYEAPVAESRGAIQQVQMERRATPEDLFGSSETSAEPPGQPEPMSPAERRTALFGDELRDIAPAGGDRLTDPIATSFDPAPEMPAERPSTPKQSDKNVRSAGADREQTMKLHHFGTLSAPATVASGAVKNNDTTGSSPAIKTHWKLLDTLNVGQTCRAELTVTNTGENTAERVSLEVRLPETVQVVQAVPQPVEQRAFLGWKLEGLSGGESVTIRLDFLCNQAGPLELATFARHTTSGHETFTVAEPKLELAVNGPDKVHVGEPASQTLVVKNPGTGVATNVTIEAQIPPGLEHTTGERLRMDIGSLNPGEVRSVRLVMGAVAGGSQIVQVNATADSGLVQTASAEVTVIAPSLRTGIDGPSLRYVGREAEYTIRVLNDGSAATDSVKVNHRVPSGFEFVRADRPTKFNRSTRMLSWYVGRLESGESLDLKVALLPTSVGDFDHVVRATSDLGAQADAKFSTSVQGAASLVVKVSDLDDPVEVGSETAYEITITNEGTAAARGVGLSCEIPQGLSFLKAEGASEHRLEGVFIGFRPVDTLPAGKSLTYRVHVEGGVAGDQRFRCRLTSESLKQPLFTEELTKFYAE